MKKLIVILVAVGLVAGFTGCGNSQPTLTKEEIQAVNTLKQMQEAGKKQQENEIKQEMILQSMLDNATIDGYKYTFSNMTGSDVQFFQLAWDEYDKNGNKLSNVSPYYTQTADNVKAGATFTLELNVTDGVTVQINKLISSGEWTAQ